MSMTALFVQVDAAEATRLEAAPALAEQLFTDNPPVPPAFLNLGKGMEERMKTSGPQLLAKALQGLDPRIREQLEARLGRTTESLAQGGGGEALLQMMQARQAKLQELAKPQKHTKLSLEKDWHGVHYLLCGAAGPGDSLLSQAVLGGKTLGEDDEGFSGYGPARLFTPKHVKDIHEALSDGAVDAEATERFDAKKMTGLDIYPGWRESDREGVLDALRTLKAFYADAAEKGSGIVTCLV